LKPEWWGSPLAQEEKYQGKEDDDKHTKNPSPRNNIYK
jgi:hypothetical protein